MKDTVKAISTLYKSILNTKKANKVPFARYEAVKTTAHVAWVFTIKPGVDDFFKKLGL